MNASIILIHFSVVLLALYSASELVRFKTTADSFLFQLKTLLVTVGSFSGLVALWWVKSSAPASIKSLLGDRFLSLHILSAKSTIIIFLVLSISYLIVWISHSDEVSKGASTNNGLLPTISRIAGWVIDTPHSRNLAIIGSIGIVTTGLLISMPPVSGSALLIFLAHPFI